ncbi:MAG TPA: response regulator transcription factor [Puia sp.]|nr:response regulator transcription factor [Puia sp.]
MSNEKTHVAVTDDHVLLRRGLADLIRNLDGYDIVFEADNGRDFIKKLENYPAPEIVLLDINMPEMDGYDTALWIKNNHPEIKVLSLSMYDDEQSIIRMLKCGAKGYILKDIEPLEFKKALDEIVKKGFYSSEIVAGKLIHAINSFEDSEKKNKLSLDINEREIEFLKLVCTELTYKEIAEKMFLSVRTVEGYRNDLFERLNVKTRVGLAMCAIKNGIVSL